MLSWVVFLPVLAVGGGVLLLFLATFVLHSHYVLSYPYLLDYGEGPLLMHITHLQEGWFPWQLYRDPALPPYSVVNYPPLYPVLVASLDLIISGGGHGVVVGRLLSLTASGAMIAGVAMLVIGGGGGKLHQRGKEPSVGWAMQPVRLVWIISTVLLLLTIPVFREWAVLLRVDMVGIGLGVWGLVALQKRWTALAALLFLYALYTKPTLIAAPVSGLVWLLWGVTRQHQVPHAAAAEKSNILSLSPRYALLTYSGVLGMGGGGLLGFFQWASGGWFLYHIVLANANRWDGELARQFWLEQWQLRWPLVVAVVIGIAGLLLSPSSSVSFSRFLLPLCYTLMGTITALGVGKVGAYANYFLEWYVGLIWLLATIVDSLMAQVAVGGGMSLSFRLWDRNTCSLVLMVMFILASMVKYSPLWSTTRPLRAGLVEENPPRLVFGRHALWEDLARERLVLDALYRGHTALIPLVQDAGGAIFTDMPGVAAEAGVGSRMQVFEHRQLLDQGLWDATPLMRDLANGIIPLVVIEYLGNWIPPDIITIITHRYAQDGSVGGFDCYRPVALGPRIPMHYIFATNAADVDCTIDVDSDADGSGDLSDMGNADGQACVVLSAYHLSPNLSDPSPRSRQDAYPRRYEAGEIIPITLEVERFIPIALGVERSSALSPPTTAVTPTIVSLSLVDEAGNVLVRTEQSLFYGVFDTVKHLGPEPLQHMQSLPLPPDLPAGTYALSLAVRSGDEDMGQVLLEHIVVKRGRPEQPEGGMFFPETGYHVPAAFLAAREHMGGAHRLGYPLTPAVPFAWGWLQCFEYTCLEWRDGSVAQRPVGEEIYRMETLRSLGCLGASTLPQTPERCPSFASHWTLPGYETSLGEPISGEIARNGYIVQWTRYARLERLPHHHHIGLGRLGEETLRLGPGMRYRWPGECK